jgi:hypothetical protein
MGGLLGKVTRLRYTRFRKRGVGLQCDVKNRDWFILSKNDEHSISAIQRSRFRLNNVLLRLSVLEKYSEQGIKYACYLFLFYIMSRHNAIKWGRRLEA